DDAGAGVGRLALPRVDDAAVLDVALLARRHLSRHGIPYPGAEEATLVSRSAVLFPFLLQYRQPLLGLLADRLLHVREPRELGLEVLLLQYDDKTLCPRDNGRG